VDGHIVSGRITGRLHLVAGTPEHIRAELESPLKLGVLLNADVPRDWPPGEYDRKAQEFFLERMGRADPSEICWYVWYAVLRVAAGGRGSLLGTGGYLGPPDQDGVVEIGYSVSRAWRGKGFAGEIVGGLIAQAFSDERVNRILAHTAKDNAASQRVIERAGFRAAGAGAEPGHLRFELRRIWRNQTQ
jgi:[ribosomal protein S5]-alanine N-acetyltransferase